MRRWQQIRLPPLGGLSPVCDMQGGWSVLGTPGAQGHLGHEGGEIPGSAWLPIPHGFATVIPPTKVNTEQASFACFLINMGICPPQRGKKRPPTAAGSGQDGAHRSPEMAAPRLCVCRTSRGSGQAPRGPVGKSPVQTLPRDHNPNSDRGRSDGKPGLVGGAWGGLHAPL